MGLRIRTLLLTVAILLSGSTTASACLFHLLDPFHWVFGHGHYPHGGYGYGNGYGYGYGAGSGYGYAGGPHDGHRVIDDWFGFGYLRDQQGTHGHYPGRPFACYQPSWPRMFAPSPCAPAPLAHTMPMPMMPQPFMPYSSPMPYSMPAPYSMPGQYSMPMQSPMQSPMWQDPCCDPCQDPCADPCMSAPLAQAMPMPMPVTTWQPMTVDRGHWQRVWVPRPVTTMVPQTQYMMPSPYMSAPMYPGAAMPAFDSGCDSCGSGGMMPSSVLPMEGAMTSSMSGDGSCCGGSDGISMQSGMVMDPAMSQMMMSNQMMPSMAYGQYSSMPWGSMGAGYAMQPWATNTTMAWHPAAPYGAYGQAGHHRAARRHAAYPDYGQRLSRRELRRMTTAMNSMPGYPAQGYASTWQPGGAMAWNTAGVNPYWTPQTAVASPYGRQTAFAQPWQPPYQQSASAYGWQTAQRYPGSGGWSASNWQTAMNPSPWTAQSPMPVNPQMVWSTPTYPGNSVYSGNGMMSAPMATPIAGDIMGDHEGPPMTAAVPIVPNSYNGMMPFRNANLARPMRMGSSTQYPNVVR